MRRFALALLIPLPFAALPLLALAFPAGGGGDAESPLVSTTESRTYQDEPLAQRPSAHDDSMGCDIFSDQS
jgi:hypothetical protein